LKKLTQERTRTSQIFPFPRPAERVEETPPYFCWLKVDGIDRYEVVIRNAKGEPVWQGVTEKNYLVPDILLEPGSYEWNLFGGGMERGWWDFEIISEAVRFLRPKAEEILASVPNVRPRHLFFAEDIPWIRENRAAELQTLRRNIKTALKSGLPERPRYHTDENALPYREYFGQHRDFCDRDLTACALGYAILGDQEAGRHAVKSLLTICDWNPAGPCSVLGPWGDEVGLSHARCLPAVYDLLYDLLNEKERIYVEQTIAAYALQCEELLNRIDFGQNPGNSHAGRVPAYLGEAALVLCGSGIKTEILERWLTLALDIYGSFFPYYGGTDGGWAEGTFYASSYTKWYLPFFLAVERFSGYRFLDRPFYQKVIHFFLHFAPPGWEIHPFGDGYWCLSDDPEWPGFFSQNPYNIYAQRSGLDLAKKWARDSSSPEIFKLHLLDVFIPDSTGPKQSLAGKVSSIRSFPDTGFISLHTNLEDQSKDIALLARASRYGSGSHQHPDQGSFALIHKGRALISPSGYYGRGWGSRHHMEWTNSTKAHNCILVDGNGQEAWSHRDTGRVIRCDKKGDLLYGELDLTEAYPMLKVWNRRFYLNEQGVLVVRDHIESDQPVTISWLLHSLSQPKESDGVVTLVRNGIHLAIRPVCGLLDTVEITDQFAVDVNEGVPVEYQVSMPKQYHMKWDTLPGASHDIVAAFCINGAEHDINRILRCWNAD
jgi:hypothetical protein